MALKCLELGGGDLLVKHFEGMQSSPHAVALFVNEYNQMLRQLNLAVPRMMKYEDHLMR